ncbi:hypothetical protein CAPTEDRAFT_188305 [Capitella teleta]|uniref:Uncharacterized protein n=1 Tax=Capitella teleta TaxID=283909 RepID=R7U409_CAPTE|nr:hypothetical protein CAPTEDRAFT_188305 [Capitella teleta]|eukprot:ELT97895.1 hypothetical protein CAPTEDRAFT_188305 [Capitella teleta]
MNGSVEATEHGTNGTYKVKDDRPQSQTPVDDVASSKKVLVQEDPEGQNEGSCTSCCAPEGRPVFVFFRLLVVILAGIVFGWCLEKGRDMYSCIYFKRMLATRIYISRCEDEMPEIALL